MSDLGRAKPATLFDNACQTVFRLGYPLARIWWRLRGVRREGAVVAIHVGQSMLLLRSSYYPGWTLPGGGIRRGETPKIAARRELAEEIGLKIPNAALHLVGMVSGIWEGQSQGAFFFVARLDELPSLQLDNREIIDARLVPIDDIDKLPMTPLLQTYVRSEYAPTNNWDNP